MNDTDQLESGTDINAVLGKLNKKFRDKIIVGGKEAPERAETGSIMLDIALGGGMPYGRQVTIWGSKSAGKSTLCQSLIGREQKKGKVAAWIDIEGTYDKAWAARLGVNEDQLLYDDPKAMPDVVDTTIDLMNAGVDIIVWDSVSALIPSTHMDGDEIKATEGRGGMGNLSRDMSEALRAVNYANKRTLFITISQTRNKLGGPFVPKVPTGGEALMFYSTQVVKLWSSEGQAYQIVDYLPMGNTVIKEPVGRKVTWNIEYNKAGKQGRQGTYDLFYAGDFVGVDTAGELTDMGVEFGVIDKGGAWYRYGEESWQGRAAATKALRADAVLLDKLKGDVYESLQ